MAIEKVINIVAKTDQADTNVEKLTKSVDKLNTSTDKTSDNLEDINNNAKKSSSAVQGFGRKMSNLKVGVIGLIVGAFIALKEILSENQAVLDATAGVFKGISTVVNSVVDAVINSTEGFDSLGKVLLGLINLVFTPFKLSWFSIELAILTAQKAWENSIFGGKNPETLERLNKQIEETKNNISEVADAAIQSSKDIANNFSEAVKEVSTATSAAIKAVEEVSVKAAIEQGKRLVQLQKQAEIAQALNTGLIEQYDQQAEKLRQLRDDDALSVRDRITANNALGIVLDKQFESMQKNADIVLENAKAQFEANKSQENQIALIDAQNEKLAINAQIEGFRSEQIINNVALKREEIELDVTASDAEKQRRINQLTFDAEREETESKRIEILRENIELENEIAEEKLARDKEIYKEGTQARIEAEQEYLNAKQELDNRVIALNKDAEKSDINLHTGKQKLLTSSLDLLGKAAGEIKEIQAAQALANTWQGVTEVWSAKSILPEPTATTQKVISTGIVLASGLNAVKNIGGSSAATAPTPAAVAPTFPIVQGTGSNQIAQAISNNNQQPIEAFVVSSNVTTAQERDRNIINEGSI